MSATGMAGPLPRPEVRAPSSWSFPEPERWRLDNGLQVMAFHVPGQHVLSVQLGLPAPLALEPRAQEGVALIMTRCLDEGTSRHTADELAELFERRGITFGACVTERGVVIEASMTARHLTEALDLGTHCLSEATFPDREVKREVRHRLADIAQERADPERLATLTFGSTFYDSRDRAARPMGGTGRTVEAITPEAVREHHSAVLRPDGGVVALAGDLADVDLTVLDQTLGAWPARGPLSSGAGPSRRAEQAGRVVFVDRPGSVQTELYVGGPGPTRRDRFGWGTYQALAMAFGGSPNARLDRVLREDKGYTYGIRAYFVPRHSSGLTIACGSVRSEVTAPALATLLELLDEPGSAFTDTELTQAGDYVARTAPGRYAGAEALAGEAVTLALEGLEPGFVTETLTQARTLDPDWARKAWDSQRGLAWTVVLVGDAAEQLESVRALGVGPVELIDRQA